MKEVKILKKKETKKKNMEQGQKQHPKDYPEEYITGKVTFFGREFHVTPDVLIPRLETEGLIRRARSLFKPPGEGGMSEGQGGFNPNIPTVVIDIGCGSGIIGTSVADLADEVIFLDISPEALMIARENFRIHYPEKRAEFIVSDLLSTQTHPFPPFFGRGGYNLLFLANLPYIKGGDWENMSPDTRYEPELALFGGEKTGFELYEKLFEQLAVQSKIPLTLLPAGEPNQHTSKPAISLIIEFGFDQREIAESIIRNYGWKYEFFADYAGVERFCEIET